MGTHDGGGGDHKAGGVNLPAKPHPRALPPAVLEEATLHRSAYDLRVQGHTYGEIAKALDIEGGWVSAYNLVAAVYGELVADVDRAAIRAREAGRLMDMRAGIEADVRRGDPKMIEADLRMTERIAKLLGLDEGGPGGGAAAGPAVQINISPPWESSPPNTSAPFIEGEVLGED